MPIIDEDRLAANIARVQSYMDGHGLNFRPHIKTHKIPALAAAQVAQAPKGINCQKITEAEVFADAGFEDILITFNILGREKLDAPRRAQRAHRRASKVVADSAVTVDGLCGAFRGAQAADRAGRMRHRRRTLRRADAGRGRGAGRATSPAAPGLRFGGLLTYPKPSGAARGTGVLRRDARRF